MVEGRPVAHPGQQLEEAGGTTDYTPAQAQVEIDKDRATFIAFAHALQDAAGMALTAIERRDAEALLIAGGHLDEACEACHRRFWYPDSPLPPGA
jgi:cytochrome c556